MAPPPVRNEPRVPPRPKLPPPVAGTGTAKAQEGGGPKPNEVAGNAAKVAADSFLASQTERKPGRVNVGGINVPGVGERSVVEGKNTRIARGANLLGTAGGAAALLTAGDKINKTREALKNGDHATAVGESAGLASGVLSTAKGALESGAQQKDLRTVRNKARDAILDRAGQEGVDVSKRDATRIAKQNARDAFEGTTRQQARESARNVAEKVGGDALKKPAQAGASAARAAVREGAEAGAKTAVKSAGRFVPGLNAAIAVADTAAFGSEVAKAVKGDGNVGKLVTSGITALGSIAAATNIPVVSQAGAIVSGVSSFVGGFFD